MGQMFNYCPKLTTIYCANDWSTSTATSDYMFSGCTSLVGGEGTTFDNNFTDKTYARPDGGLETMGESLNGENSEMICWGMSARTMN